MSKTACGKASSGNTSDNKEFACSSCGQTWESERSLKIHRGFCKTNPWQDKDTLENLLSENNPSEIADKYGIEKKTVTYWAKKHEINAEYDCSVCGSSYYNKISLKHHKSREHGIEAFQVEKVCEFCGSEFATKRKEQQYCSGRCKQGEKYWFGEKKRYPIECNVCEKTFYVMPARKDNNIRFCSRDCKGTATDCGENSPHWKGGVTHYYGPNWHKQRQKAKERDDNLCRGCGVHEDELSRNLHVHHIKKLEHFKNEFGDDWHIKANELSNLVCLCPDCHRKWEGLPIAPQRN